MKKSLFAVITLVVLGFVFLVINPIGCSKTSDLASAPAPTPTQNPTTPVVTVLPKTVLRAVTGVNPSGVVLRYVSSPEFSGNPAFPTVYTTPEIFSIGIWQIRLFKGLDDTTPFTLVTYGSPTSEPVNFSLTAVSTQMATGTEYPTPGNYNYLIPTIAYVECQVPQDKCNFFGSNRFRVIMSSYESYQAGDVLVYSENQWQWITTVDATSLSPTRPDQPLMVDWPDDLADYDGYVVFEPKDVPFPAVNIPANPTGTYAFTLVFDVTNGFRFNDPNNDGRFDFNVPYPTGDYVSPETQPQVGPVCWNMKAPTLTVSVENY